MAVATYLLFASTSLDSPARAAAEPTVVYVNPAAANLFLGAGPLVLQERVQGVPAGSGLGAFQVRVTYHQKFVTLQADEGPFLSSTGKETACVTTTATGQVTFGCISIGGDPGPSGSGVLATLEISPVASLQIRAVPGNYAEVIIHNVASGTTLANPLGIPYFITAVSDSRLYVRPLESDVNVDCAVDFGDMDEVTSRYGATTGSLLYSPFYDLEPPAVPDGDIDILDIQAVSARFGSTCSAPHPPQPQPLPPCPDSDGDLVCDKADYDFDSDGMSDKFEAAHACLNANIPDGGGDPDGDGLPSVNEQKLSTDPCAPDSDSDGLLDGYEAGNACLDPLDNDAAGDPDSDGLSNNAEFNAGSDPCIADTDGDDLSDGAEINTAGTNVLAPDTDGDGLDDGDEVLALATDPLDPDTDDDGLSDGDEVNTYGLTPTNPDSDDDGLQDGAEVLSHLTDPLDPDSDADGLTDGLEVNGVLTNPLNPDTDDDALDDGAEVNTYLTDPLNGDSDGDGLADGEEALVQNTDPLDPDTDNDGITDGGEVLTYGTSPLLQDSEADGIPDGYEVVRLACGFDPLAHDSGGDIDSDTLTNAAEFSLGTEPCEVDTDGDGCGDGRESQDTPGSQLSGGQRDPLDPWDYFNPSGDGKNRVDDILDVIYQYFVDAGEGGYTDTTDRTFAGPMAWNSGAPDGKQRIDDVLHSLKQYFHDCA